MEAITAEFVYNILMLAPLPACCVKMRNDLFECCGYILNTDKVAISIFLFNVVKVPIIIINGAHFANLNKALV